MWRSLTKGEITYPMIGYARLFGSTVEQAEVVINELVEMQICDSVTHGDGKVTLINRRMQREAKDRAQANNRQYKYRERQKHKNNEQGDGESDGKVMTYSSSSSSSALQNSGGGTRHVAGSRGNGKPPPAAAESPPLTQTKSKAKEARLDALQTKYPQHDVRKVREKYLRWCSDNQKEAKWEIFEEKWLKTEFKTMGTDAAKSPGNRRFEIEKCGLCDANGYIQIGDGARICKHEKETVKT
jgi:hypothetical protein